MKNGTVRRWVQVGETQGQKWTSERLDASEDRGGRESSLVEGDGELMRAMRSESEEKSVSVGWEGVMVVGSWKKLSLNGNRKERRRIGWD